jgi:hypothetical protein
VGSSWQVNPEGGSTAFLVYRGLSMPATPLLATLLLAAVVPQASTEPTPGFGGDWSGSATLSLEADGNTCRYTASDSHALTLRLAPSADRGSIAVSLPPAGEKCPAMKSLWTVTASRVSGNSLSISDDAGHEWSLTLREGRLTGLVSGGAVTGEVDLEREAVVGATSPGPGAPASPAAGAAKPAKGSVLKGTGGFIAANVVGVGALVGLNYALKDKQQATGAVACSPRSCVAIVAGDCTCNTEIANGGMCGKTVGGVTLGGACHTPDLPCQSDYSCNNSVCEDKFGRCPF